MTCTISIITPSFNQGRFIERTIQSVISQNYEKLEYIVIDGGSTDNTTAILKKYDNYLRWISEHDQGQTHAVNKGIKLSSGDIIGWLNSDDIYYPNAIHHVMELFNLFPEIDIIYGDALHINENDQYIEKYYTEKWNLERLKEVCYLSQPAVFFRKNLVDKWGYLNESLHYCMDYEYWLRLALKNANFHYFNEVLAGSRLHADTKTLGSRVKVHKEINDMLKMTLGKVPDRWLSNYSHMVIQSNEKYQRPENLKKMRLALAYQTLLASLRWNKGINKSLLKMTWSWIA